MSQKVKITKVKHVGAPPRKIFTSVNMLSSEAKPTHRVDTNGRVSIDFPCKGKSILLMCV